MNKFLFYILIPLVLAVNSYGKNASLKLSAALDKQEVTIGEHLKFDIKITHPYSVSISLPQDLKELGDWTVISSKTEAAKDRLQTNISLLLAAFSTGTVTIPALELNYAGPGISSGSIKTHELSVNVKSLLSAYGDQGDIRDIKPPLIIPFPAILYVLIILALMALGAAIYYYFQKKNKGEAQTAEEIIIEPADVIALRKLEELKVSELIKSGLHKEFYITLTDIMREYFERAYGMEAKDRTTSEIFYDLRNLEKNKAVLSEIKSLLNDADLVKFAKLLPGENAGLEDIGKAEKIILTKKQEETTVTK